LVKILLLQYNKFKIHYLRIIQYSMGCSNNKKSYYLESEAQEALIRSNIRFVKAAVNYYVCDQCSEYHLTSKGETNLLLNDLTIKERINKERQLQDWSESFGRR